MPFAIRPATLTGSGKRETEDEETMILLAEAGEHPRDSKYNFGSSASGLQE